MCVGPVLWDMLAFVCCVLLIFAGTIREHAPALQQVRVDKTLPVPAGYTTVELHLSDPQNIPFEQAQVIPTARLTNMEIVALSYSHNTLYNSKYRVQFSLSMS